MDIKNWSPTFYLNNETDCFGILQEQWNKIPLANGLDLDTFRDGSLVRFKGMIQDMYNPEYYLAKYEVIDEISNETSLRNGKFLDCADCKEREIINVESSNNVTEERQTLVIVSLPGLNPWVEKVELSNTSTKEVPNNSPQTSNLKRTFDSNEDQPSTSQSSESSKKVKTTPNSAEKSVISTDYLLNFPIAERPGKVFQVKVYKDSDKLKINDAIEFVGFLSLNPELAKISQLDEDETNGDSLMEIQTHNPPPSLIPRLHCVSFRELKHCNPLLRETTVVLPTERVVFLRKELHMVLTQLLLGDELAAEYLIYHLMSSIYLRKDLTVLGKFSLNISNIPSETLPDYGKYLSEFLGNLLTKSHYFPMTLDNMNETTFIPRKDYECDRLTSGLLQLSKNTHLIMDETCLKPGKMNESGVKAIAALSHIIKEQRLSYDFKFYQVEYETDVPFLFLSEGKSMLPSDYQIVLKPEASCVSTFNEIVAASKIFLKPELLDEIRVYLTLARMSEYELNDNVHTLVENHFVTMRQQGNTTAEDLHQLLVLARLICLSEGKKILDEDCWKRSCQLESDRKARLVK